MDVRTTHLDFIIVIPVYNDKVGLSIALKNVQYNKGNFGVVIIDDGSRDKMTEEEIKSLLPANATLHVITLNQNAGITHALNTGLDWIYTNQGKRFQTRFIARLDSGDICSEDRFEKQVAFLEAHEDIDLLGSWCVFEDFETGEKFVYRTPTADKQIKRAMHFRNIFIHPTVMWRVELSEKFKHYPENFPHAEDYGLFYQWMSEDVSTAIIPESLVTCRINPKGLSLANRAYQLKSRIKVIKAFGNNKFLTVIGILKLWALLALPYSVVFKLKKMLAAVK